MSDTVLVSGGAGYVGSHIVVELARGGYEAIILDSFRNSSPSVASRLRRLTGKPLPVISGDVRDRPLLARVFAERQIAAVVHCAGLKSIGEGEAQALAYHDVNVGGAIALIDAMAVAGVRTLVFSSSATVYGEPERNPVAEDARPRPVSVYGRTKRSVELMLEGLAATDGSWRIGLLRYFNPAGAHPDGEIGESPASASNLVPVLAEVALGRRDRVDIFGDDYPTADGTGVRDYLHVQDLAAGHVAVLERLRSQRGVLTLNLGMGRGCSVLEVIAAFERASGRPLRRRIVARRPGDVAAAFADPARARSTLGWAARRDLDAICADAWRWALRSAGQA